MVVVARERRGVELISGFAGCPICRFEARFEDGDLHFAPGPPARTPPSDLTPLPTILADGSLAAPIPDDWSPDLERTIALLGLSEPGGAIVLSGRYAALAPALVERFDVGVIQFGTTARDGGSEIAALVLGETPNVPFTDGTFRAVAVDMFIDEGTCADLVRTLAIGGRMLATTLNRVPAGVNPLARDAHEWVASREMVGSVVELRRRT